MLHSIHHYYACYYALLCLLHQQQQAASITIIIDGATTNEWATRDEYQRLVDSSQSPGEGRQVAGEAGGGLGGGGGGRAGIEPSAAARRLLLEPPQLPSDIDDTGSGGAETALAEALAGELLLGELNGQRPEPAQAIGQDLSLALDRLDLIEQQQQQRQRSNRLRALDEAAASSLQQRQRHQQKQEQQQQHHQQQHLLQPHYRQQVAAGSGARTISDLVPLGDEDIEDPLRRLKERGSVPKRLCGKKLMEALELVCDSRFYGGDSEPQVVDPTVKTKRFAIDYEQQPVVARRRKLRTLAGSDGRPANSATPASTNDQGDLIGGDSDGGIDIKSNRHNTNRNHNQHHHHHQQQQQQQQQYLSPSSLSTSSNQNQQQQLSDPLIDDFKQQNLINENYNNANLNNQNVRNRPESKKAMIRRIRGANADCCLRSCYIDELKPYCKP